MTIDTEALRDIIERLEMGGEVGRHIDAAVAVALRIGPGDVPQWIQAFPEWRARSDGQVEVVHNNGEGGAHWKPAPVSTSLDAVAALQDRMLPGYSMQMARCADLRMCSARVNAGGMREDTSGEPGSGGHIGLAAAWLAAILRAVIWVECETPASQEGA